MGSDAGCMLGWAIWCEAPSVARAVTAATAAQGVLKEGSQDEINNLFLNLSP